LEGNAAALDQAVAAGSAVPAIDTAAGISTAKLVVWNPISLNRNIQY
jgi:hypothetical protein